MTNKEIAKIFREMADLLEISGEKISQRVNAYKKAAAYLESLKTDVREIYKEKGISGLKIPKIIGEKNAKKIEEYIKKGIIKDYEKLKEETAIRQIVTHYFETKGLSLAELKQNSRQRKIIYSRYTRPAKQLLELAGSLEKAKQALDKVAQWAKSRNLDYVIETVAKRWLELDRLKPKEIVKKPYYQGNPMIWSQTHRKWYVVDNEGRWLEFAGKESEMEWRQEK